MLGLVFFNLSFGVVIAATMADHPKAGMRMLYNLAGPLVGNRRKLSDEVNVQDLEYADDMA